MKALRFHARNELSVDNVPPPSAPSGKDVIVEVSCCGICGTDLHEYLAGPIILPVEPHPRTGAKIPIILGHEFSGVVRETGPGVSSFRHGDRVAVLPHLLPDDDYFVRRNLGQFSPATGLVGLTWHWGGMGEMALVPEQNLVHLPETVTDEQGATLEPAAVAVNAIDVAEIGTGSTVLITGAGPIGALTALAARAAGASRIFLYDPNPGRLDHFAAFDDLSLFSGSAEELLEAIAAGTEDGVGVDAVIECAGHPAALELCIDAVKRTGVLALVGLYVDKQEMDLFKLCEKGIRLIGCWGNDVTIGQRLVDMIASGKFPVECIVTERIGLDEAIEKGFDVLAKPGTEHLKILIDMSR